MYTTKTTRTVRTFYSDGRGPPKVETKTFTYGGDGGSSVNGGINIQGGGGRFRIRMGGGGEDGGDQPSYSAPAFSQRPQVIGRPSRKDKKDPFSGVINQSYDEIKKRCQEEGCLFEDPEFDAEDSSIFFSRAPPRPFEWKRPHEICDNPVFIADGASRFDVQQGELGDCWLLAAIASLTVNQRLFAKVVPPDQSFEDGYCGMFRFHFWRQGEWVEVVVDDRLPTYYGQLTFMHSVDKNEFWSALLEKAYAKLEGSYESLKGGSTCEAMVDFTGGVSEFFDLRKAPPNLFSIMLKASQRGSLMGCSIDADPNQLEARLANGLVMGHAYSITSVILMDIETPTMSGKIPMVRIRNPWGNEAEWKGRWSDQSREWSLIPDSQKDSIGLTFDDDGEFWMSFDDFSKNFEKLEICNLGPDSLEEDELDGKKRWEGHTENGEWIPRVNAGGCRNYLDTFWTNPQYRVTLTDPDDDDDDDLCTILVGVLQKDRRKKRKEGLDMLTIGYVIYKIPEGSGAGPLPLDFFKYNASCAKSNNFINMREVCTRHKLPSGQYCIIPSTFQPHQQGNFLLRLYTEQRAHSHEMDEETGIIEDQGQKPKPKVNGQKKRVEHSVSPLPGTNCTRPEALAFLKKALREIPPPTEEEQEQEQALKASFRRVAGEDMEIDAYELRDILNAVFTREFAFDGFSIDVCRSMVAMHDGDLSGKLGFDEFKVLWADLRRWKGVFKEYDRDKSGNLSSYELRSALHASGFRLSNRTFSALVMRYSSKDGNVEFGDFILCAIRMKTMLASFKNIDVENSGHAAFDLDSFIQTVMYS
ncbi:calpain-B-like isoform X1 [Crassostrea angulata]|uniref:calpain-B-like isoform X1 n=1 Tax=Magallana angulata TaxID=2784310 RepID=UPI0022B0A6FF|nr:calpain-B-like isoform X1 [Crassostrea angulata]XP_052700295.1 calpain-B-like isoform X1 [Crassostrea angulata]